MKLRKSGTKTKIGICILLFSFVLFPMSPSISLAENGGTGAASGGEGTGAAPGQAEAAGAAAAQAGAGGGLSGGAIALIAVAERYREQLLLFPLAALFSLACLLGWNFSEGGFYASTGVNWKPGDNWVFNFSLAYEDVEYGDEGDINDNDFYYYDVEETTIGVGFMYTW